MLLMPGLRRSTCSCIWLWLYWTTPTTDFLGSNCGAGMGQGASAPSLLGREAPAGTGPGHPHLYQLVPGQPIDDLDDKVLGDLEVVQADALGAVHHEEDVDGAAPALCTAGPPS